ncbi:HD-GYP domain-containing protein [Kordiimonas aestuarii]|uniref:HD-GYP domain-containing protein n=1 Tax=Kordiimonas aestuarii TaxID=1005925 RepID=UPI0021CE0588|nr:HD domain-containing phosphohydrolase [Kordiimonas aestuarii]
MAGDKGNNNSILLAGIVIIGVAILGFLAILKFAESEAEQNMARWEDRLNLVADSRATEVSAWLNRYLSSVEELAGDATIQLYAGGSMDDMPEAAEGQRGYVFALLSAAAEREGFHEKTAIDQLAANVKRPQRAGLAILRSDGSALVATSGMPVLRPGEWPAMSRRSFIAIGPQLEDKTPLVIFGAPVMADEGLSGDNDNVNWVIGARPLDGDFLKTLDQPGAASKTAETYIVTRGEGELVTPLTPLAEGGRVGEPRVDQAASFAAGRPGAFDIHDNYAGTKVLVTGRELSAPVPWVLVRTISGAEALAEINERRNSLIITLSLAALFVLAGLVLAWRHGVSRRLEASYREQAALSAQNEGLSRFLQSVSDSQPTAIAALDDDLTVRFANRKLGEVIDLPVTDLTDRRLDTAFTSEIAEKLRAGVKGAANGTSTELQLRLPIAGTDRIYQTQLLPLDAAGDKHANTLLVMQDISSLVAAKEQSETLFKQLVSTLTQIIDARDPWSKHHSERVADVASTIALERGWETEGAESVRIAGQLVNLGKIFVPTEILTKQSALTDEEFALVRDSMQKGASLVAGLDFKGPVAATLGQMRENWDGSGEPDGKKGDEIEPGARILSVANAFVGMVSARAHRPGLGFDKALDILNGDAGKKYERRTVAALQNILENKGGRERWYGYTEVVKEGN